jgi:hypothetical protein
MEYMGRGGGMNLAELIWWPIHFSDTFCFMAAIS